MQFDSSDLQHFLRLANIYYSVWTIKWDQLEKSRYCCRIACLEKEKTFIFFFRKHSVGFNWLKINTFVKMSKVRSMGFVTMFTLIVLMDRVFNNLLTLTFSLCCLWHLQRRVGFKLLNKHENPTLCVSSWVTNTEAPKRGWQFGISSPILFLPWLGSQVNVSLQNRRRSEGPEQRGLGLKLALLWIQL